MERNPNDNFSGESNRGGSSGGQYGGAGGASGGGYGSTGGSTGGSESGYGAGSGAGSQGSYGSQGGGYGSQGGGYGAQGGYGSTAGTGAGYGSGGAGGAAGGYGGQEGRLDQAREKAGEIASNVSERAGNLKSSLADKLEAGANRLRGQDFGDGSASGLQGSQGRSQVSNRVAGGMQATADWLRNAELDDLRTGIERQARENPGRTLLIALGVGYLLGKAFRR